MGRRMELGEPVEVERSPFCFCGKIVVLDLGCAIFALGRSFDLIYKMRTIPFRVVIKIGHNDVTYPVRGGCCFSLHIDFIK